jgi:hypothetical protein
MRIESNFEFDQNGISYLADLNHEKLHKIEEFIKKAETIPVPIELRKVTEIGEEEKKILLRRYQSRRY